MDFINNIVVSLQENSDPLGFIGVLITAILSIYLFKAETSTSFIRERYDKLIFPLFDLIEPFLFHKCPEDIMEKALCIIEENKSLADGTLLEVFYYCKQKPSPKNFRNLCIYIDRTYDKFCRCLGLRKRPMSYRISRGQYRGKGYIFFYALLYTLLSFVIGCVAFFMILLGISLLPVLYEAADPSGKLIILLFTAIFGLAIVKYVSKH